MFSRQIDFLAIGDIATDTFIRLKEASVNCDISKSRCEIWQKFGDKIPYDLVEVLPSVGNSANAAVSASRLGLRSAFLGNIGDDEEGKECITELRRNKVDTRYVHVHRGMKTNHHYVLWYENDRTILIKHEDFKYSLPKISPPKWIYLSSVSENSRSYHIEIAKYLKKYPEVRLAFQPGTFQIKLGTDVLKSIYARTEVFICNLEEAQKILGVHKDDSNVRKLLGRIRALGPKIVLITDGPKGAYMYDGNSMYFHPIYPDPKPPVERTGAGDALASTFVSMLIQGKSLRQALSWSLVNSMNVVQYIGAQKGLLSAKEIEKLLKKAPQDYKATLLK
jgi:sugar/nucleoside kinase (ribokinase family)